MASGELGSYAEDIQGSQEGHNRHQLLHELARETQASPTTGAVSSSRLADHGLGRGGNQDFIPGSFFGQVSGLGGKPDVMSGTGDGSLTFLSGLGHSSRGKDSGVGVGAGADEGSGTIGTGASVGVGGRGVAGAVGGIVGVEGIRGRRCGRKRVSRTGTGGAAAMMGRRGGASCEEGRTSAGRSGQGAADAALDDTQAAQDNVVDLGPALDDTQDAKDNVVDEPGPEPELELVDENEERSGRQARQKTMMLIGQAMLMAVEGFRRFNQAQQDINNLLTLFDDDNDEFENFIRQQQRLACVVSEMLQDEDE